MSQPTVNPYEEIGKQLSTGLASIIATLPGTPTIDDLVNAVYAYVAPIYYAGAGAVSTQVEIEIKSVARNAANSYINNLVLGGKAGYNANQAPLIDMLIGAGFNANVPIVSLSSRILNVEENIPDGSLTIHEQTPLFLATTIGAAASTYWLGIVTGGPSGWAPFLPPSPENYMDLPYYVSAAMNGAA
jgi:hypothetical protein